MRVRFKIVVLKEGKKLTREELINLKDPLHVGIRYILEFKYLEATKWLMLSEDSQEKYTLLALVNYALHQNEQARDFWLEAQKHDRRTPYTIALEIYQEGKRILIEKPQAFLPDFV